MELNLRMKSKITRLYLKTLGNLPENLRDMYLDLINGEHSIDITIFGKYTVAEITYFRNGYEHHFIGISSKNPKDELYVPYGVHNATKQALGKLILKFLNNKNNEGNN